MDFIVDVAAVGAGYTTSLVSRGAAAIVDFGSRSPHAAVQALDRRFGDHPSWHWWFGRRLWRRCYLPGGVQSVLISHPHSDHYNGLMLLGSYGGVLPSGERLIGGPATLFYPRLPRDPEAAQVLYLMATLNKILSRIPETSLSNALVACAAGPVTWQPLSQGDRVELAGQPIEVLWPPPRLGSPALARLRSLVRRYEELAAAAAEAGDERLVAVLAEMRERWPDAEAMLYRGRDTEGAWQVDDIDLHADEREHSDDSLLVRKFRELHDALKRGANLLSLAFATADRRYVFLGDLDESTHPEVVPALEDFPAEVLLSAHHGTHFGAGMERLRSRYVITSVGRPLLERVRDEYATVGMHLRTDEAGDVTAFVDASGAHVCCRREA